MIYGIGTDICDVRRIRAALQRHGERFAAKVLTEAGGLVGNFSGDADFLHQRECLAGNPRIYGQMVQVLGKYSRFASVADKMAVTSTLTATQTQVTDDAAPL